MIYGPAVTAFAIGVLFVFIWFCLLIYSSARKRSLARALRESTGLFIGAVVTMALLAVALFGSYWAADRFILSETARKVLYDFVAVAFVFVGWSTWSILRVRRRHNRFKQR